MPIRLLAVEHGRPAAEALRRAVGEAKAGDPLRAVTVVVPSNTVGVASRRQLASGSVGDVVPGRPGLAAVTFLTVYRLAELLGAAALAAAGRRPVSTPVLAAALRHVLAEEPGVFAPVASHPATEEALVAAHRELRDLSPGALAGLASTTARAGDVVRIHRRATAALRGGWYDEHDLFAAAVAEVDAGGPLVAELGPVVVHLPQVLTRSGGTLLARLGGATDVTIVAAITGHPTADADVLTSLRRSGVDPADVQRAEGAVLPSPPRATRIVSVSDADEEARAAVRAVVDAARAGTPLNRTAVVVPQAEPYARLVHEHLAAAGLPHNGPSVRPLRERVVGRTLLGLLGLGDHDLRRDAVFDLLTDAPLRDGGGTRLPTAAWEVVSREAGIVSGLDQWDQRLAGFATARRATARELEAAGVDPTAVERVDRDADRAESLRGFVLGLADALDLRGEVARTWRDRCERLAGLVHRLLGAPTARGSWPLDEQRAADRVDAILQRLATLDPVAPHPSADAVRRTIELELDADLGRDGRLGDGVVTGPLGTALGLDLDLVVVLGLAEGTLPGHRHDDALLPDRERQATAGELRLRSGQLGAQHRQLLAALAAAGTERILVLPRGDLRRSAERVPSRWAVDAASALAGDALDSDDLGGHRADGRAWFSVVPSHAAALTTQGSPATVQEWRVRALATVAGGDDPGPGHPLLTADPALRRGAELLRARASEHFTRFDGNLGPALGHLGLRAPTHPDAVVSATGLESWVTCPFHYFVRSVLRVEPVDNPEERVAISPLDYGTLVHAVLEDHVTTGVVDDPDPARAWARLRALGEQRCAEAEALGVTGHPLFWAQKRRRLLADLAAFAVIDRARLEALDASPFAAELRFGFADGRPPLELPLPGGRSVRFRGSIDRVDRSRDGSIHVIDYKTGKSDRYRGLTPDDPLGGGTKLQLPLYGLAARAAAGDPAAPVHSAYWFPTSLGGFGHIGYVVDEHVVDALTSAVDRIVTGIDAGVFVPRPDPTTRLQWVPCTSCDPDGLGVGDRRREWERKRHDPALVDYVRMVEPDALDDPDAGGDGG